MALASIGNVRDMIELLVTGVSILGGLMAFYSGSAAAGSALADDPPHVLADCVNRGLAEGFIVGLPTAVLLTAILAAG